MTLTLDLPNGAKTLIDDADKALTAGLTLYVGNTGYVYFSKWVNGRSIPRTLHGLLMTSPRGMHVDHINGNKLDNRRANLRIVTGQVNQANRKNLNKNNTSGIRGVSYCPRLSKRNPWLAQITANRRHVHLGMFPTKEEAIAARRKAELEYFGEYCPC